MSIVTSDLLSLFSCIIIGAHVTSVIGVAPAPPGPVPGPAPGPAPADDYTCRVVLYQHYNQGGYSEELTTTAESETIQWDYRNDFPNDDVSSYEYFCGNGYDCVFDFCGNLNCRTNSVHAWTIQESCTSGQSGQANFPSIYNDELSAVRAIATPTPTEEPTSFPTDAPSPAPTDDPTAAPTSAPTWVTPCMNNPCDCGQYSDSFSPSSRSKSNTTTAATNSSTFEDSLCDICHANGCSLCKDVGRNFKLDWNYPCINCQDVFGDECRLCQDFIGCGQCNDGYIRTYDEQEDLYYCAPDPDAATDENCPVVFDSCETDRCTGEGENPNCEEIKSWGCIQCKDGYWMNSKSVACTVCSSIDNCEECKDNIGCTRCKDGYKVTWTGDCSFATCVSDVTSF